jgi:hypothetical protein
LGLARFRPQKPDGGSYPYHYVLDQLGTDVVAAQRGDELPRRDQARLRRWHVLAYKAKVRPDGHGIWTERDRQVSFFVEFDNNTEPLWKLIDKIDGYAALAKMYQRVWPVLFSVHSAARERHLHQALSEDGVRYPVATTARNDAAQAGYSPAEAVWWLHRHDGALLRLADLAATIVDSRERAA